jgi:hypothetical protein
LSLGVMTFSSFTLPLTLTLPPVVLLWRNDPSTPDYQGFWWYSLTFLL